MANVLTGKAAVYGLNGDLAYTGVASPSDREIQSAEIQHNVAVQTLQGQDGITKGSAFGEETYDMTIDFVPTADATGNTLANAKLALKLPTKGAAVTLSSFDHADYNGAWQYLGGGRIRLEPSGYTLMTLPLRKYESDLSTVIS